MTLKNTGKVRQEVVLQSQEVYIKDFSKIKIQSRVRGWCRKICLSPTVIHYRPFQGGGSVVVLRCLFLMSVLRWRLTLCVFILFFSSVCVAEWLPFGKELLTRLTICSLCILNMCNVSSFPFWFGGLDLGSDCFSCVLLLVHGSGIKPIF